MLAIPLQFSVSLSLLSLPSWLLSLVLTVVVLLVIFRESINVATAKEAGDSCSRYFAKAVLMAFNRASKG